MKVNDKVKSELDKMMSGELYDATNNDTLLQLLEQCEEKCYDYNNLRPGKKAERDALLRSILGKTGQRIKIIQPFLCDYGFNIEVGEDFFANMNLVILDEAKVRFGNNVFIGPNCSFYTACHPLDVERRNKGLEYSLPITVGNNVWFGGNVVVLPGVTIGDNCVVGAGSVVTHDVEPNTVVAGNPCRVIKKI